MHDPKLQSWTYDEVSAVPLTRRLEDHLLAAVRKLTSHLGVDDVCDAILVGVSGVFAATASWIQLHDAGTNVLRTCAYRGPGADAFADIQIPLPSTTIAGMTFERREFMFVADVRNEGRWANRDAVQTSGIRSVLTVPLIAGEVPVGVLGIYAADLGPGDPPSEIHIKRLELFAAQAAIGVTNARLYEASQRDREKLRALLRERRQLRYEVTELRKVVGADGSFGSIVGESAELTRVLEEVEQVASSDVTVLLLGETGTGKELIARALHERSRRA